MSFAQETSEETTPNPTMGGKLASEMEEGDLSGISPDKMESLSTEWKEKLQLAVRQKEQSESFGLEIPPDPRGEWITKRKKKSQPRLSTWEQEQEDKDLLDMEEAVKQYRRASERREARKQYVLTPKLSKKDEWGDEEEHESRAASPKPGTSEGGQRGAVSSLADEDEGEAETHSPRSERRASGRRGQRERSPPRSPRRKRKIPPLPGKYDGNPKELDWFLASVENHMADWGRDYESEAAKVRHVTSMMVGRAAAWWVSLHKKGSPLLRNYQHFMAALAKNFEDPGAGEKAKARMKTIRQGKRAVSEYTQEFNDLVPYMTGWSEAALLDIYKEGLDLELYKLCRLRASPGSLESWIALAAEMEPELMKDRYRERPIRSRFPNRPPEGSPQATTTIRKPLVCYNCGKEGHRAAFCRTKPPPTPPPSDKKGEKKPVSKQRETAKAGGGLPLKNRPPSRKKRRRREIL